MNGLLVCFYMAVFTYMINNNESVNSDYISSVSFCEKSDKSNCIEDISTVDVNKPCLLCLGGERTHLKEILDEYYLSPLTSLMDRSNLRGKVTVCGALYDFKKNENSSELIFNPYRARTLLFHEHKRLNNGSELSGLTDDECNPRYVEQLYDCFIKNRICDDDGKKLAVDVAKKNIRSLVIYAHCHGSYSALKLEELMQKKMKNIGYSKQERAEIQSQLLVVNQAPACPLGISKSMFLSFCCVQDYNVNHNNYFQAVCQTPDKYKLNTPFSYFEQSKGNFFLIPNVWSDSDSINPHSFGIRPDRNMNMHAFTAISMANNAIVRALKNSLNQNEDLPDVKDLVCRNKKDKIFFEKVKYAGERLWDNVVYLARTRHDTVKKMGLSEAKAQDIDYSNLIIETQQCER